MSLDKNYKLLTIYQLILEYKVKQILLIVLYLVWFCYKNLINESF